MEMSENEVTQEITQPEQVAEETKEIVTETAEVTQEATETPLSIEDIASGTKKSGKGIQRRIDELTREKYEARREADYWKEQADKAKTSTPIQASGRPIPPVESDFPDPSDYRNARIQYEDTLDVWRKESTRAETTRIEQEREFRENHTKFVSSADRMRTKYPDFDDSINQEIFTFQLKSEIFASDFGPEIGYFLSKNPAEAERLGGLSLKQIAKEIGKFEAKFSEAIARKPSSAPAPLNTIQGDDVVKKDPSKMTDAEWYVWDKQERMKKFQAK